MNNKYLMISDRPEAGLANEAASMAIRQTATPASLEPPSEGRQLSASGPSAEAGPPAGAGIPRPGNGSPVSGAPAFPPLPGETPRAFSGFMAYFRFGHGRSLQAVAEHLGENHGTVKNWSSRFRWVERINAYNSGLLERELQAEAEARRKEAADWARRTSEYREQKWAASQNLLNAVQCFLHSFGDREMEKMTLGQVSRALQISSRLASEALTERTESQEAGLAPLQIELLARLKQAYGNRAPEGAALTSRECQCAESSEVTDPGMVGPHCH